MAATARQEREMRMKYEKMLEKPDLSPLERARAFVMSKGVRSLKSLHRVFRKLDDSGDHKLSFNELYRGLQEYGIYTDRTTMELIFHDMDKDGTGFVTYDEFLVALRPPMNQRRLALVYRAFTKLDRSGTGVVTSDDLKGVYNGRKHPRYLSGEWSEEDVFKEFLNSFNGPDESGEVDRQQFEEYYAGVSASIDTDAYFDLMMRQAWKL